MDKANVLLLAQLLHALREVVAQLEQAHAARELEQFTKLKKEALDLTRKINALL